MKKLFFITFLLLSSLILNAQKCIVLDFKIGDNVTAEDVEAISYEFRSSFIPSCYSVEDNMKLRRIMKEFNYDPTAMRKEQIRKLGRDLVAVVVVYGTLEKFMNEYSLDVLVMDVSTGTTIIHESSTFQQAEYHSHPRKVSKGIATKLCNTTTKQSNNIYTSVSNSSSYQEKKKTAPGYTDLGLPSGKMWKNFNANGLYTYEEAVKQFGNRLPTKEDWEELKAECQWSWTGNGYRVTGPNGNSITLQAEGIKFCNGGVCNVGSYGFYWSSTKSSSSSSYCFYLDSKKLNMESFGCCGGLSIRLIQN